MKTCFTILIWVGTFLLFPSVLSAHDVTSQDQILLNQGSLWSYLWVGAKHMLTGYDHLLFLLGVVFCLHKFVDIVKFISVFTLGHACTLIGASYFGIQVNEYLIDAIIAGSVIYKGFENLNGFQKFFSLKAPNLLVMVLGFGLLHGMGLATRFQSFDIGKEMPLAKLVTFNVGVELGQVLALIPMVWILNLARKSDKYESFYKIANLLLIVIGLGLLIYQLYGYFYGEPDHHHHHHHHHPAHDSGHH